MHAAAVRPVERFGPAPVSLGGARWRPWWVGPVAALGTMILVCGYGTGSAELKLTEDAPMLKSHHQIALNKDLAALKAHAGHEVIVTGTAKGDTLTISKIEMPAKK